MVSMPKARSCAARFGPTPLRNWIGRSSGFRAWREGPAAMCRTLGLPDGGELGFTLPSGQGRRFVVLQRAHVKLALLEVFDSFRRRFRARHGGKIRHLIIQGVATNHIRIGVGVSVLRR